MYVDIPGPAGALEAHLSDSLPQDKSYAVLCHPHPLYGGDMHDHVLGVLTRALEQHGVACLGFNFRGVGRSEGRHDGHGGEVDDVLAAIAWLQADRDPRSLILGGYSFGASMVWLALDKPLQPQRVMLIAPPVGMTRFAARQLDCPVDVFAGDRDPYVSLEALEQWQGVQSHLIAGADHFFGGRLDDLAAAIDSVLG